MLEDAELLRRYAEFRDQAAFAELVNRHVNQVYASALRRTGRDAHLAADAVQLVFIALARQSRWLVNHPALSAWLHLTTRNHAANLVRGESRRKRREQEASFMHEQSFEPNADKNWMEATPALDEALDQLSERDRAAILLRFAEKRTYAEIGAKLDLKENAARMRVDRALERLRAALAGNGIVSTVTLLSAAMANQSASAAPVQLVQTLSTFSAASAPSFFPSATTLYQLMTTTKTAAAVGMSALALLFCTVTVYEGTAALRAGRNANEAFTRAAVASQQAARISQQTASAQNELARLKARADAENVARKNAATANTRVGVSPRLDPTLAGNELMLKHPEVRVAFDHFNQAHTATRYQAFFNAMHLSPAQVVELKSLLSVTSTFSTQTDNDTVIMLKMPNAISWKEADEQIQAVLGPDSYKEYLNYNGQIESRDVTTQVSQALVFSPEPLSSEQSDQMVALLAAAEKIDPASQRQVLDWNQAIADASTVLSPVQLEALKAVQNGFQYNQALFAFEKKIKAQK